MKKNLELKDICGYLPYGLKVVNYCGEIDEAISLIDNMSLTGFAENNRPLLRTMSDLTKEIEHKGEKFVPFQLINQLKSGNGWTVDTDGDIDITDASYILLDDLMFLFDKLNEWMFDYRGLIGQGLAIAVTEENNPYK